MAVNALSLALWWYDGTAWHSPTGATHTTPPIGWSEDEDGCLVAWREFSKTYDWYNVGAQCKPALRSPPAVSLTYQQPEERSPAALVQLIKFRTHFQQMLQAVSRPGQPVYVCDPYHTSMVLDPHAPIRDWLFSPAVCGEYVLFVTANGKHGLFINPWERTFCFFGGTFVEQLKSVPPVFLETFCKLIR